jgi:hypothetical protein
MSESLRACETSNRLDPDSIVCLWKDGLGRVRKMPDSRWEVEIVDRSHPAAAEGLVSDLSRLRREAGSPSLGQLVKLSQHKLSKRARLMIIFLGDAHDSLRGA